MKRLEQGAPYRYPIADGASGWPEKVSDRTTGMHLRAKSDDRIGSRKPPNKDGLHPAVEAVDGRRPTETHSLLSGALQTQARTARRSDCNMCGKQHVGIDVVGSSLLNNTPSASLMFSWDCGVRICLAVPNNRCFDGPPDRPVFNSGCDIFPDCSKATFDGTEKLFPERGGFSGVAEKG